MQLCLRLFYTGISLVFALALLSCGNKSKGHTQGSPLTNFFVKGDPVKVAEGSNANRSSFLTLQNYQDFNRYQLVAVYQFTEKETVIERSNVATPEAGNEAQDTDTTDSSLYPTFTFSEPKKKLVSFRNSSNGEFSLNFLARNDGRLMLNHLIVEEKTYPVEALHYSYRMDRTAFSFLLSTKNDQDGKVILAFYFMKSGASGIVEKTNPQFKYLFGPGVKVAWDAAVSLNMDICGKVHEKVERYYRAGISMWSGVLKKRLKVNVRNSLSYPPFSDLNTHCVYTIDNYLTLAEKELSNTGSTTYAADVKKAKMVDADIFIWKKEIEKSGQPIEDRYQLTTTLAHEFGHVLGLDHQFEDGVLSMMSYDDINYLSDYDQAAVKELYPELPWLK